METSITELIERMKEAAEKALSVDVSATPYKLKREAFFDFQLSATPANVSALITDHEALAAEVERQAGEIERLRHERNELGNAIAEAAIKRGIIDGSIPLDGPQLLMICGNLAD